MNTINNYEKGMVEDTVGSSDKNAMLSPPIIHNKNKADKDFSDLSQIFNGNPSKKTNVLDQSLTFTDDVKNVVITKGT